MFECQDEVVTKSKNSLKWIADMQSKSSKWYLVSLVSACIMSPIWATLCRTTLFGARVLWRHLTFAWLHIRDRKPTYGSTIWRSVEGLAKKVGGVRESGTCKFCGRQKRVFWFVLICSSFNVLQKGVGNLFLVFGHFLVTFFSVFGYLFAYPLLPTPLNFAAQWVLKKIGIHRKKFGAGQMGSYANGVGRT